MKNQKYALVLDRMLRSIEKRDSRSPQLLADTDEAAVEEGKYREAICQILAEESFSHRLKLLMLYPELIPPYLFRIRSQ